MSDKERLDQIFEKYSVDLNGEKVIVNKDIDWLIEQAEKAEKYREVLEFYADENNYFVDITKLESTEDIFYVEPPILEERGIKARKALEG